METSKLFNPFQEKTGGTGPAIFRRVCTDDVATVEDGVTVDFFLYNNRLFKGFPPWLACEEKAGKASKTVDYFVTTITSCMCRKSKFFSKPIIALRVINSPKELRIWSDN